MTGLWMTERKTDNRLMSLKSVTALLSWESSALMRTPGFPTPLMIEGGAWWFASEVAEFAAAERRVARIERESERGHSNSCTS